MKLYAPNSYWNATKEERKAVCNGCGAKGGLINPPEFLFHASAIAGTMTDEEFVAALPNVPEV